MALSTDTQPALLRPVLVGRGSELACLRAALGDALAGRGSVVTVAGAAGTGKTRLLAELRLEADVQGVAWLAAATDPARHRGPYGLVADLPGAARQAGMADPGESWQIVEALVPDLGLHGLASGFGPAPLTDVTPDVRQTLLQAAIARGLQELATRKPLVLCVEDFHWADSASLHILGHLASSLAQVPVLVVATYRPQTEADPERSADFDETVRLLQQGPRSQHVELRSLSEEQTRAVIGSCFDGSGFRNDFLGLVYDRSQGVPHLIVHYLAFLRDQGVIRRRRDLWTNVPITAELVPEYRASIAARLRNLSDTAIQVLGVGAACGQTFDCQLVARAVERPDADVGEVLDNIALTTGLLHPEDGAFAFEHELVCQAIYEGLTADQRRQAHKRLAAALQQRQPHDHDQLAHHLTCGGEHAAAVPHLIAAAQAAFEACAFWEAHQLLGHALAGGPPSCDADRRLRHEALLATAEVAARLGEPRRAEEICQELLQTIPSATDSDIRGKAMMHLGRVRSRQGEWDDALRLYQEARTLFTDLGERRLCATVDMRRGNVAFERSQLTEAEALFREARAEALEAGSPVIQGGACTNLGVVANVRGDYDAALGHYARAVDAFQEAGYSYGLAMAHHNLGMTHAARQRWDEALASYTLGETLSRQSGTVEILANILVSRATAQIGLGDLEAADASCRGARLYYEEMQDELGLAECTKVQGILCRERGQSEEAERLLLGSRLSFQDSENQLGVGECSLELGILRQRLGDRPGAGRYLLASAETFDAIGAEREGQKARELLAAVKA